MEDTQRDRRVATQSSEPTDDDGAPAAPAAIVARLLANPRRVRRD